MMIMMMVMVMVMVMMMMMMMMMMLVQSAIVLFQLKKCTERHTETVCWYQVAALGKHRVGIWHSLAFGLLFDIHPWNFGRIPSFRSDFVRSPAAISFHLVHPCTSSAPNIEEVAPSRNKLSQVLGCVPCHSMSFHVGVLSEAKFCRHGRPVVPSSEEGTWILWSREGQCPSRWSEIHVFSPMFAGHVPSFYNSQVGELWRITWKNMISHPYLGKDRQSFATSQKHLFPVFFSPMSSMSSMSSIINDRFANSFKHHWLITHQYFTRFFHV